MANYFPLIANPVGNIITELPAGDFLNLSSSGIANSGNISVTGIVSATDTITGGNLATGGTISATGNITGSYILGNGSQLTGIDATSIQSGTSNVRVVSAGGNVTVGIGGTSNVMVVSATGTYVTGIISATGNISGGNVSATVISGTLSTAAQPNITSVGTLSSVTVDGIYGNVATTAFAGVFATAKGPNPYSIMQVRSNDGTTGLGMQAYAGLSGLLYSSGNIVFQTGATVRDKDFPTGGTTRATIDTTGLAVTGLVSATGNVIGSNLITGNITIGTDTIKSANSILTLDPAADGVSGLVVIAGNLQVTGTTTTIDSTTVYINDLMFNVANNAATSSEANGGGLGVGPVGGEYVKLYWDSAGNTWDSTHGISAVGTVTATQFAGSAAGLTSIPGANVTGTVPLATSATSAGTVTTAAQPNITSVGTLSSLAVTGNISGGNVIPTDQVILPNGDATLPSLVWAKGVTNFGFHGNLGTVYFAVGGASYHEIDQQRILVNGQTNDVSNPPLAIESRQVGLYTENANATLSVTVGGTKIAGFNNSTTSTSTSTGAIVLGGGLGLGGNIYSGGLISAAGQITGSQFNGSGAGLTGIPGANVTGTVPLATSAGTATSATTAGTVTTAAQPNITSVGTLTSLVVSGNASSATAVADTNTTQLATTAYVIGQVSVATPTTIGTNTVGTSLRYARADHTHTGVATLTGGGGITVSASTGAVTLNSTATSANTAGAIVARGASGEFSAGIITATATSARYADLAEKYTADADYEPGTVLIFGGEQEVTISTADAQTQVVGVVSTNPAYVMNSALEHKFVAIVALTGRTPVKVIGPVCKGDFMISAANGHARACDDPKLGTVIGKAIENFDGDTGVIEVLINNH